MVRDEHSIQGVLELHPKGFGFLRNAARNYVAQQADPYVPAPLIQRLGLREGLLLTGPLEAARGNGNARHKAPAGRAWLASNRSRGSHRTNSAVAISTTSLPSTRTSTSVWKPAASR